MDRVNEIYRTAAEENRKTTAKENREIAEIQGKNVGSNGDGSYSKQGRAN